MTFRPTKLDKMIENENFDEDQNQPNPDQKLAEPNCTTVMKKCMSELLAILIYVGIIMVLAIGLM